MKLELFLTALVLLLIPLFLVKKEGFAATSPGTLVQLRTSHVPTEEDWWYSTMVYPKIVRREITSMTGSDPGPLLF
jgi:hypothetical protein